MEDRQWQCDNDIGLFTLPSKVTLMPAPASTEVASTPRSKLNTNNSNIE